MYTLCACITCMLMQLSCLVCRNNTSQQVDAEGVKHVVEACKRHFEEQVPHLPANLSDRCWIYPLRAHMLSTCNLLLSCQVAVALGHLSHAADGT